MPDERKKVTVPASLPAFDLCGRDGLVDARLAGFKAHNLMRMALMGFQVPQGFVLSTDWCRHARKGADIASLLSETLHTGIRSIEECCGLRFGCARRPLLVSVRSGAPVSMPGMMDTLLNIGLNDQSLPGLLRFTGDHRLVWDSYRRLIHSFAEIVAGIPGAYFENAMNATLQREGMAFPGQLGFQALRNLAHDYLALYREHVGSDFPQDPHEQMVRAVRAVLTSWMSPRAVEYRRLNTLPNDLGTAVTIQRMVFGNAGGNSGSGVGFTRDPASGENRLYVDWLAQAQGEDIVSGRRQLAAGSEAPTWLMQRLARVAESLENTFLDAQEFEFTVENGELYMLQTRTAKRSALATLRIAVEQVASGLIAPEQALERLSGIDLEKIVMSRIESPEPPLGYAIAAGPGVVRGPVVFSVDAANDCARKGSPPILVRKDIATDDIAGFAVVGGILTASGGRTSHAAVVARQMGKVCLVGCVGLQIDEANRQAMLGDTIIREGDSLCIDGETGAIHAGNPKVVTESPQDLINRVRAWQKKKGAKQRRRM